MAERGLAAVAAVAPAATVVTEDTLRRGKGMGRRPLVADDGSVAPTGKADDDDEAAAEVATSAVDGDKSAAVARGEATEADICPPRPPPPPAVRGGFVTRGFGSGSESRISHMNKNVMELPATP